MMNLAISTTSTAFGTFSVFDGIPEVFRSGEPIDFLLNLDGPAAFVLDQGHAQTRVVSCLLHGNESSGLTAVARTFQQGPHSPHANMIYLVGNVRAAKAGVAYFMHRLIDLPMGQLEFRDMNRIWHAEAPIGALAFTESFKRLLAGRSVEAVLDLHNTSGHNPPHGVTLPGDPESLMLAGHLVDQVMTLQLGTGFMGAMRVYAPSVLIECGKMGLLESDVTACRILEKFLMSDLSQKKRPQQLYHTRATVYLDPTVELRLGGKPERAREMSLRVDLERFNLNTPHGRLYVGTYHGDAFPLRIGGDFEMDIIFDHDGSGHIWLKAGYTIAMATLNESNIRRSCLFFLLTKKS